MSPVAAGAAPAAYGSYRRTTPELLRSAPQPHAPCRRRRGSRGLRQPSTYHPRAAALRSAAARPLSPPAESSLACIPVAHLRPTPAAYRRVTLAALVALVLIVVTGAAVRLTGSGLGCPDWPTCDGSQVVSEFRDTPEIIEFVNRMFTGVVSVAVAAAVLGARRRVPYRRDLALLAWGLVAGVVAQIVLGGITVLLELTPPAVMAHFLLSVALVADAVVLHHRAGEPDGGRRHPDVPRSTRRLSWALVAVAGAVLVVGTAVTGTGPHGGDPDVERLPYAISEVVRVHAVLAWVATALLLVLMVRTRRGAIVLATVAAQITIGYVQYFNGVPEVLVGLHVLGATVVWITVLRLHLSLWVVEPVGPEPSPEPSPELTGS
jgi:cytochrome c oxidase assembly protein subunit 15